MAVYKRGFTIVELLIVIVVIGILALIVTVAYNGIQQRARNTSRAVEARAWNKMLQLYQTLNGNYPAVPNGSYCLGDNFPFNYSGGERRCRNYGDADTSISYRQSDNAALMSALATVGRIASTERTPVKYMIGPYIEYWGTGYQINTIFEGSSAADCPSGFTYAWTESSSVVICMIRV